MSPTETISIAIPTYNRSHLILESLNPILNDHRIYEIVIRDDASQDYDQLVEQVNQVNNGKIRLVKGEINLGAFENKREVLALCQTEWAVLLDSDNVITSAYLDTLYAETTWDPSIIYCPEQAAPNFLFFTYSGQQIRYKDLATYLPDHTFQIALNTGNYFVPVQGYLQTHQRFQKATSYFPQKTENVRASDVLCFNFLWLTRGGSLKIVPNLRYFHRVHETSYWLQYSAESEEWAATLYTAIIENKQERFNLSQTNLLWIPNWKKDPATLSHCLHQVLQTLLQQPHPEQMTLLIDGHRGDLALDYQWLGDQLLTFALATQMDLTRTFKVEWLYDLSLFEWESLLPWIQARLQTECDDDQAWEQLSLQELPVILVC